VIRQAVYLRPIVTLLPHAHGPFFHTHDESWFSSNVLKVILSISLFLEVRKHVTSNLSDINRIANFEW
jgi:hypothetical protein